MTTYVRGSSVQAKADQRLKLLRLVDAPAYDRFHPGPELPRFAEFTDFVGLPEIRDLEARYSA
ncbi:MAG: hypothetical protein M3024_10765 [Candidatus Dormibacteraeota bacterium]|nr:hypothetical protein [Candidatus Dormibacteraeota bacterium]